MLSRQLAVLLCATLALACLSGSIYAQFIPTGGESPRTARMQIPVGPLRVIYPLGHDSLAIRVATYAARYRVSTRMHRSSQARFPILMRSYTPIANGMVAWVPSRMELYTMTGAEEASPTLWLNHLISHEMRHYAQLNALSDGPFKYLYYLLGEQSVAIASFFTPLWFFEGDAIAAESRLTGYGRSQSALTYQQFRTDILTGNQLSYDQYLNRSLRYPTPTHYAFGSMLVEYANSRYGNDFWEQVVKRSRWYSFLLFPFHFGIKSLTGKTRHQLFRAAMKAMDSVYRAHNDHTPPIATEPRGEWHDERYPHIIPNSQVRVVWKRSMDSRNTCYSIDRNGIERRIIEPANLYGKVRYLDTLAIWSEIRPHPIWELSHKANIRVINLLTGKTIANTRIGNYISPILLPNQDKMVAIRVNSLGAYQIVTLPLESNAIAQDSIQIGKNLELREICPTPYPQSIAIRAVDDSGMHLLLLNLLSKKLDTIVSHLNIDASGLISSQKGLYFSATHNYARRGFCIPWKTVEDRNAATYLLNLPSYGIEDITPVADTALTYASYTINGYRVNEINLAEHEPLQCINANANPFFERFPQYTPIDAPDSIGLPMKYSKLGYAIKIHSWTPTYSIPSLDFKYLSESEVGITLMSQNDLGTLSTVGSLFYTNTYGASLSAHYSGIWPHIGMSTQWGGKQRIAEENRHRWKEPSKFVEGSLRVEFPLLWVVYDKPLVLRPSIVLATNNNQMAKTKHIVAKSGNLYTEVELKVGWYTFQAPRNINPRWGGVVALRTGSTLVPTDRIGGWYGISAKCFMPGFSDNHSVTLSSQFTGQWNPRKVLVHRFQYMGQHSTIPLYFKVGSAQKMATLQYTLPIAYPDLNVRSWFYLKRVHSAFGVQYASIKHLDNQVRHIRTMHMRVEAEIHPFRTPYECTIGAQTTVSPFRDRLGATPDDFWHIEAIFHLNIPPRGN